jgi:hypothetical protein
MKVAVVSESHADEVAIRILIDAILGTATEGTFEPRLRSRGKDAVFAALPSVIMQLYYHSDADGMVVVVDSDLTPVHRAQHDDPGKSDPRCRLCRLRSLVRESCASLRAMHNRSVPKVALGLAVPQIEAWCLAGMDHNIGEVGWREYLRTGQLSYRRQDLKPRVYGTDRPSTDLMTRRAREEAERIVREGHLPHLESLFPGGFGALASDLRGWLKAES